MELVVQTVPKFALGTGVGGRGRKQNTMVNFEEVNFGKCCVKQI